MSLPFRVYLDYLTSIDAIKFREYGYLKNISIYSKLSQKGRDKLDRTMDRNYKRLVKTSDEKITTKENAIALARKMTGG
jgi:hypothetical protein